MGAPKYVLVAELLTNCVLHKEYDNNQYIGVYLYSDHITFVNHNRPLPPVTIEDMNEKTEFGDRKYLNPEIKEMFFALDLIESYGSGIRRTKKVMADNNSPELVLGPDSDEEDCTIVTAYINKEFADVTAPDIAQSDEKKSINQSINLLKLMVGNLK